MPLGMQDLVVGEGAMALAGKPVTVHYTGETLPHSAAQGSRAAAAAPAAASPAAAPCQSSPLVAASPRLQAPSPTAASLTRPATAASRLCSTSAWAW